MKWRKLWLRKIWYTIRRFFGWHIEGIPAKIYLDVDGEWVLLNGVRDISLDWLSDEYNKAIEGLTDEFCHTLHNLEEWRNNDELA